MNKIDLSEGSFITYEQNQGIICGIVSGKTNKKYSVVNEQGATVQLSPDRVYLIKKAFLTQNEDKEQISSILKETKREAELAFTNQNISELWEFINDDGLELSESELSENYFGNNELKNILGVRMKLLSDKIYFKRTKNGFTPRLPEVVEELKVAQEKRNVKERKSKKFLIFVEEKINNKFLDSDIDIAKEFFEEIDVLALYASNSPFLNGNLEKEAKTLVSNLKAELNKESWLKIKLPNMLSGSDEAFAILYTMGIFNAHENLSLIRHRPSHSIWSRNLSNFWKIAQATQGSKKLLNSLPIQPKIDSNNSVRKSYLTSESFTIDDVSTQDIDDALSFSQTIDGYELGIHITDLSEKITPNSQLENLANQRGTSIYVPGATLNMLPNEVVKDFSLVPEKPRDCLSLICELDRNFEILNWDFKLTSITSTRKYSYDEVDSLLDEENPPFSLLGLSKFSSILEGKRGLQGALFIERKEVSFNTTKNFSEKPQINYSDHETPARKLVAEMMIMYNHYFALYAKNNDIPVIFRSQEEADPELIENAMSMPDGPAREFALKTSLKKIQNFLLT